MNWQPFPSFREKCKKAEREKRNKERKKEREGGMEEQKKKRRKNKWNIEKKKFLIHIIFYVKKALFRMKPN